MLRRAVSPLLPRVLSIGGTAGGGERWARRIGPSCNAFMVRGFLDLHQMTNREAIEKEKARLNDELSRGYFADMAEIRKNDGKIASANKTIIPEIAATPFPELVVNSPDGGTTKLPVAIQANNNPLEAPSPCVSLVCLSFRANSQKMAESWSVPFLQSLGGGGNVQVYEVSFIDSWLLSSSPVRRVFLKMMKASNNPQRKHVFAFGDHYDFRKQLNIVNLLTGYIFLIDRFGRIRWQGFGAATQEELSSLLTCASLLLGEE